MADNPIHAQPGEWVQIEGSDRRLLAMTAVVYLLPLALLIGGWLLAEVTFDLCRCEKVTRPFYRLFDRENKSTT